MRVVSEQQTGGTGHAAGPPCLSYLVPYDDMGNMEPVRAFVVVKNIGLPGFVDDDNVNA